MGFHLFTICVCLIVTAASAGIKAQTHCYFTGTPNLPDTPMPKALSDLVRPSEQADGYNHNAYSPYAAEGKLTFYDVDYDGSTKNKLLEDQSQVIFFFEKDMHSGTTMKYSLARNTSTPVTFLSREAAEVSPFSSTEWPEVLSKFSVKPGSSEAHIMKKTIQICEGQVTRREEKYRATSLESMVDFVASKMGTNIRALSTDVEKGATVLQNYTIPGMKKLVDADTGKVIACHKLSYGYAVFFCHTFAKTRAYAVPLKGHDGTNAKAVGICHVDTSEWSPKNFAMQELKAKPGTVPICHFLAEGDIAWVSSQKPT